jgi:hypothetical protein
MYSPTLSLTQALDGVGGQRHASTALRPRKRHGTHCIERWVVPRTGMSGSGKSSSTGIRSPDRPSRSQLLYRLRYRGTQGTKLES